MCHVHVKPPQAGLSWFSGNWNPGCWALANWVVFGVMLRGRLLERVLAEGEWCTGLWCDSPAAVKRLRNTSGSGHRPGQAKTDVWTTIVGIEIAASASAIFRENRCGMSPHGVPGFLAIGSPPPPSHPRDHHDPPAHNTIRTRFPPCRIIPSRLASSAPTGQVWLWEFPPHQA